MVFEEIELCDVCWIYLAVERNQCWAFVYVWKCVKFLSYLSTY